MTTPNPDQAEQCPQWMKDAALEFLDDFGQVGPVEYEVRARLRDKLTTIFARHHAAHCREGERAKAAKTKAEKCEGCGKRSTRWQYSGDDLMLCPACMKSLREDGPWPRG